MDKAFVPVDFVVPTGFEGPGFHLEPLAPVHNERDHQAWMTSIDHIRSTPGMDWKSWPTPMTLEENLADMEMHHREFMERESFTFSILGGDEVIGCIYIEPSKDPAFDVHVRSWVRESRAEMDEIVRRSLRGWLEDVWPFQSIFYASRG